MYRFIKCPYHSRYYWVNSQCIHHAFNAHHLYAWAKAIDKLGSSILEMRPPLMVQKVLRVLYRKKLHKKELDIAILLPLSLQYSSRHSSAFNSVRGTYSLPYSTNYLPTPGYPFFPYVITILSILF